jgi:Tfp pilus assembly protein PilF
MYYLSKNIFKRVPISLGLLALVTTLSGCNSLQNNRNVIENKLITNSVTTPSKQALNAGIKAINEGDLKLANHELTLAIKQDLKNPYLHAANALAYQIRARRGEQGMFDLAETGYLVAIEQKHDFQNAAIQLSHLYFENKNYEKAQRAAAYAIKLEANNIEALQLLAGASYALGDVELALWAIEQAKVHKPNDKRINYMTPTIYSAAGLNDEANDFLSNNEKIFTPSESAKIRSRISQWKVAYDIASLSNSQTPGALSKNIEQVIAQDSNKNPSTDSTEKTNSGNKPEDEGPLSYSWADCTQQLIAGNSDSKDSGGLPDSKITGSVKVDETLSMKSLPSPCKGRAMPQIAIIDVVILRTNEISTSNSGINLLENLAVTIQQSSNKVTTTTNTDPRSETTTITRNIGLGTSAAGAIAYSLNIANVGGQTTEVVSRPSLQVLDRQPSQFFSGSSITIGLTGGVGSSNTLNEVNVGLSMSITPTFIDDSQLLLNVKAVHTFFEPVTGTSSFSQSLQTSRNMVVSATKINLNETLVLSGLTEREAFTGTSGVPILKDIPGLQYLFSRKTVQNFNKTVLILITPRRMVSYGETIEKVTDLTKSSGKEPKIMHETRLSAQKELGGRWPNLYHTVKKMSKGERSFSVRSNDIDLEDWNAPGRIKKFLQDVANTLYF